MYWKDEGYLLSKTNVDENSIFINTFTLNHGKYAGIVYGGSSRKQKRICQVGNKIVLNYKSKGENKAGYFNVELIEPITPIYFDDKKRSTCILSASSILKLLLPERQENKKIYNSFEKMLQNLKCDNWINLYIEWELLLIKELGYEIDFLNINYSKNLIDNAIKINDRFFKIPKILFERKNKNFSNVGIKEALIFNKSLLMENFILPHRLRLPLSRNILEKYYN